jgi:group I intron endonuclease
MAKFDLNKYRESLRLEDKTRYGVVYIIENKINGKQYIGQTTRDVFQRFKEHSYNIKNSSSILNRAFRKYGKDNFHYGVLFSAKSKKELDKQELDCIRILNTISPNGYNLKVSNNESSKEFKLRVSRNIINKIPWNKGKKTGPPSNKGRIQRSIAGTYLATNVITGVETCYLTTMIPGFNSGHIIQCCKGKLKTHKGHKWEYYDVKK